MSATTVVHRSEPHDVFIGRPSKWGNPFHIGRDGTREEVIEKYRTWLLGQPQLLCRLHQLRGKRLGCFCAPLPCHGDVLARLADSRWDYSHTNLNNEPICRDCGEFGYHDWCAAGAPTDSKEGNREGNER